MKKEFGKWLMDIAKYIVTAVILSSIYNDFSDSKIIYIWGSISAVSVLLWGLYLVKEPQYNGKKQLKKRKK